MVKLYSCGEETKLFGPISIKNLPKAVRVKKLNKSEKIDCQILLNFLCF